MQRVNAVGLDDRKVIQEYNHTVEEVLLEFAIMDVEFERAMLEFWA